MQNKPTLDDVMLAILAMDSYARGDRFEKAFTNIDGTELQTQIGKAIVRDERGEILDGADTAGFNASAYNLDDAVVISYRGTDFVDGLPNFRDVGFGWTGSIGFSLGDILEPIFGKVNNALENILGVGVGDQVISAISGIGAEELQKLTQESLALQFYEEVTGNDAFDRENANVVLTGHSLGGSLAGAVSSISGNDAVVFNEIPFTIGALRAVISENTDRLKNATADVGGEAIINFIESLITGELILPEGINADIFAALPIADNVTSFQTTGEIAEIARGVFPALGGGALALITGAGSHPAIGAAIGSALAGYAYGDALGNKTDIVIDSNGGPRSPVTLHSDALLAITSYAEAKGFEDWKYLGDNISTFLKDQDNIIDAFFNDEIGEAIFEHTDEFLGYRSAAAKTLSAIAYSALGEEGDSNLSSSFEGLVFGNTGIRALFDDANQLGKLVKEGKVSSVLEKALPGLNETIVQFSGLTAFNKVIKEDHRGIEKGIINLDDEQNPEVLSISLSQELWKTGSASGNEDDIRIVGVEEVVSSLFSELDRSLSDDDLDEANEAAYKLWRDPSQNITLQAFISTVFSRMNFALVEGPLDVFLPESDVNDENGNPIYEEFKANFFAATSENDKVRGTIDNDLIAGGDGDDELYGGAGKDLLIGGLGSDIFYDNPTLKASDDLNRVNENDIYIGGSTPKLLITEFVKWLLLGGETDEVRYSVLDGLDEDATLLEKGLTVEGIELIKLGDVDAIELIIKDNNTGTIGTDTLVAIERTVLSERRDYFKVKDEFISTPLLLDLGGFAPDDINQSDFDEVDYSQLSRGITYVNGTTRFADEGDEGRNSSLGVSDLLPYLFGATPDFLSFGDQRENDALRVTGAENITATDHDDTLWFGQIGFLQSLLSGWPADLGASPFGTIDAGDGNDLIAFTGADVVLADDLIPEEYGGEAQTPNPETRELEGGSIAAEQLRVTIDGGKGDDYILARGGTGAIIVGGEGRDFIFNTSDNGQIYGDTIDGLDSDGNPLDHTSSENADTFWFWPGTFIQDAQPNDRITLFGIPLVGGSNAVAGIPAGDGSAALDFFSFGTYYTAGTSGQLAIINLFARYLDIGPEGLEGVQIVENYDFGGFSDETYGRAAPGDLGLTFRIFLPADRALEGVTISLFNAVWGNLFTILDAAEQLAKLISWLPEDDPLILDLDGDGIETVSESQSGVHFDLNGDFFAESTGWVSSDDGFLALDKNGNGRIDDITELFGAPGVSGFTELAANRRVLRGVANDNEFKLRKAA